ncbi:hypothetical protein [Georgenia sp. Z1491]|uniref:hypothetical protein n=1 Tax=Georgenia sp. Z1491 TaxID=3416707 RepID=UPI003CF852AF
MSTHHGGPPARSSATALPSDRGRGAGPVRAIVAVLALAVGVGLGLLLHRLLLVDDDASESLQPRDHAAHACRIAGELPDDLSNEMIADHDDPLFYRLGALMVLPSAAAAADATFVPLQELGGEIRSAHQRAFDIAAATEPLAQFREECERLDLAWDADA